MSTPSSQRLHLLVNAHTSRGYASRQMHRARIKRDAVLVCSWAPPGRQPPTSYTLGLAKPLK
eukprot:28352-Pelagomonas_calceolata.AAC.1